MKKRNPVSIVATIYGYHGSSVLKVEGWNLRPWNEAVAAFDMNPGDREQVFASAAASCQSAECCCAYGPVIHLATSDPNDTTTLVDGWQLTDDQARAAGIRR